MAVHILRGNPDPNTRIHHHVWGYLWGGGAKLKYTLWETVQDNGPVSSTNILQGKIKDGGGSSG